VRRTSMLGRSLLLTSTAALAFSRGKRAVTICPMLIFPDDTSRIAPVQSIRRVSCLPLCVHSLGQVLRYRKRNLRAISLTDRCMKGRLMKDLPTPMTKTRPEG
jgi:hypothetical protein